MQEYSAAPPSGNIRGTDDPPNGQLVQLNNTTTYDINKIF